MSLTWLLKTHSWRGLGHQNLKATPRTATSHGHFPPTSSFPCRSDLPSALGLEFLQESRYLLTSVLASPVSSPAYFLPQLRRLSTPNEDRQGSGSCRNLPGRPVPPSHLPPGLPPQDPMPALPKPRTDLQVQSSLPLCTVFLVVGQGGSCPIKAWRGQGADSLSPHSDLSSSRQEIEDASAGTIHCVFIYASHTSPYCTLLPQYKWSQ